MTLEEGIEKHLEGKTLDPKIKLEDICEFVTDKAREYLSNESGAIDDTTVFSWVDSFITTDYVKFYADKEKEETPTPKKKETKPVELKKPEQQANDPVSKMVQLSLFGDNNDTEKH